MQQQFSQIVPDQAGSISANLKHRSAHFHRPDTTIAAVVGLLCCSAVSDVHYLRVPRRSARSTVIPKGLSSVGEVC